MQILVISRNTETMDLTFTQLNIIKIIKKDFKEKLVKDIKDFLKNNEKKMKNKGLLYIEKNIIK